MLFPLINRDRQIEENCDSTRATLIILEDILNALQKMVAENNSIIKKWNSNPDNLTEIKLGQNVTNKKLDTAVTDIAEIKLAQIETNKKLDANIFDHEQRLQKLEI